MNNGVLLPIEFFRRPGEMICASVVRDTTPSSNMADTENTNMEVDDKKNKPTDNKIDSLIKTVTTRAKTRNNLGQNKNGRRGLSTTEYCAQLQAWMWQYYTGYLNWQSWLTATAALPCPFVLQSPTGATVPLDVHPQNWHNGPFGLTLSSHPAGVASQSSRAVGAAGGAPVTAQPQQVPPENGNAPRPGNQRLASIFKPFTSSQTFFLSRIQTSLNDLIIHASLMSIRDRIDSNACICPILILQTKT